MQRIHMLIKVQGFLTRLNKNYNGRVKQRQDDLLVFDATRLQYLSALSR